MFLDILIPVNETVAIVAMSKSAQKIFIRFILFNLIKLIIDSVIKSAPECKMATARKAIWRARSNRLRIIVFCGATASYSFPLFYSFFFHRRRRFASLFFRLWFHFPLNVGEPLPVLIVLRKTVLGKSTTRLFYAYQEKPFVTATCAFYSE